MKLEGIDTPVEVGDIVRVMATVNSRWGIDDYGMKVWGRVVGFDHAAPLVDFGGARGFVVATHWRKAEVTA